MSEVQERKEHLIRELWRKGVYLSKDNRAIKYLSLYELEWLHIEVINNATRYDDYLKRKREGLA